MPSASTASRVIPCTTVQNFCAVLKQKYRCIRQNSACPPSSEGSGQSSNNPSTQLTAEKGNFSARYKTSASKRLTIGPDRLINSSLFREVGSARSMRTPNGHRQTAVTDTPQTAIASRCPSSCSSAAQIHPTARPLRSNSSARLSSRKKPKFARTTGILPERSSLFIRTYLQR